MAIPGDALVYVRTRSGVQPQDGQLPFCQSTTSLLEDYMAGPSFPNQGAIVKFPKRKTLVWLMYSPDAPECSLLSSQTGIVSVRAQAFLFLPSLPSIIVFNHMCISVLPACIFV